MYWKSKALLIKILKFITVVSARAGACLHHTTPKRKKRWRVGGRIVNHEWKPASLRDFLWLLLLSCVQEAPWMADVLLIPSGFHAWPPRSTPTSGRGWRLTAGRASCRVSCSWSVSHPPPLSLSLHLPPSFPFSFFQSRDAIWLIS